jgi:predicted nucleic acid-binding protein
VAIFVDTGAWFAVSVPDDPDHVAAISFMRSNRERLISTDYIYDELLTLFRARGHVDRAKHWMEQVRLGRCDVIRLSDLDIELATNVFFDFSDKEWSFTDCTSYVLMERIGITKAFSFDDHFRQFGTVTVVP